MGKATGIDGQWRRLWRRVYKKPNGCYGWYGCVDTNGFPTVGRPGGGNDKVHRVVFAHRHPGVNIKGLFVVQVCRDHGCLNVDHMKPMTKRQVEARKNPLTNRAYVVTSEIVRQIRNELKYVPTKELQERFGVSRQTIWDIRNFRTWTRK